MSKTVACIIARTVSSRLPLKILRSVKDDRTMLDFIIERIKQVSEIDEIYLCTSNEPVDDILEDYAERHEINLYRGSPDKVIERMIHVGEKTQADNVIRITGDNVFSCVSHLPDQIRFLNEHQLDYVRIIDVPIGYTTEVISFEALKHCYSKMDPSVSEYLMLYMFEPRAYKCGVLKVLPDNFSDYSLTVDTPEDLKRTRDIIKLAKTGSKELIELKHIIPFIEHLNYARIDSSGTIKLPYDQVITYGEFKDDMNRRVEASKLLKLF